jgi:hypothetical protein
MAYVDLYCERLGPGLLAEPVNAITNAAFFVAAWLLCRHAQRSAPVGVEIGTLLGLIVAIGIGSTLFHTLATTWARWLDVLPILLFQLAFLWTYARGPMRRRALPAAALVLAFLGVALYARRFPHLLSGSLTYAPAIVAIFALGIHQWLTDKTRPPLLLAAAAVFTLSLTLRTVDGAACQYFALGTHFFWHLLNAVVLYLAVRSLLPPERRNMLGAQVGVE